MDISSAFAPLPETPESVALAERLGSRQAWVFDAPALQLDVWMTRPAERTGHRARAAGLGRHGRRGRLAEE